MGKLNFSSMKTNYTYACAVKPYILKAKKKKTALVRSVYYLTECTIYFSVHISKTSCDLYHIVSPHTS